ncbi:MAG: HlyD family efflux transporter periplasmic adaptor subunit [Clostridia bacterium]|nr:HlyD family efflux transporter periplasmic adaptor subunit [Clostridia bacterium]
MKKSEKTEKKNKGKKKFGFLGFLGFAFALIVAANVIFTYGSRLETTIVRSGAEEDSIPAEGFLFRDQTVIYAPSDGYLYCEAAEDERVSLGEVVMYIYKSEINLSATNELKNIEKEISELSAGLRTAEIFSSDTAKLEQTIAQSLRSVPKAGARDDMEKVAEISDAVNSLIEKRRIISGEIQATNPSDELAALKAQKAELEKKYNIERTIIHAPKTGAFTARIDGLEEKLSLAALENVNAAYIKELNKLSAEAKTSETVTAGEPIGKIVNNYTWSIAAQVSKTAVEGLNVGDKLNIRFSDVGTQVVAGTVSKITPEESGKVVLVVSSNKYIDKIYSLSKAKVEFVKDSFKGLRIPAKSLRMTDGVMGVYVVRSNKARFVPVELLYNGKDWVVVKQKTESAENPMVLKLYDELIIGGKDIYEGKVVR